MWCVDEEPEWKYLVILQVAFSYYLYNGFSSDEYITQFDEYNDVVGEARDSPHTQDQTVQITDDTGMNRKPSLVHVTCHSV